MTRPFHEDRSRDRIRVLVVDDSVVARKIISDVLLADPGIDVVGIAPTGRIALAKIPALEPDVLTLDVDMPDMSGLETLAHVRRLYPRLRVIMCSTLTERGAAATIVVLVPTQLERRFEPDSDDRNSIAMRAEAKRGADEQRACAPRVQLYHATDSGSGSQFLKARDLRCG